MTTNQDAVLDTVIIGGGQSGLALGYWLARQHREFLILDENERAGESWRQRWDSLRLFTPAKYDGLPGAPFPGDPLNFPTKDELADYLEDYVRRFDLPWTPGVRVDGLASDGDGFLVSAGEKSWRSKNVVIATGGYRVPKRPAFATELEAGIVQLHSQDYRNPAQLRPGPVLVVGLGNSGAEIAVEVSRSHQTTVAGKPGGELPVRHGRAAARFVLPVVRFLGLHVLTLNTPIGRKVAPEFTSKAAPLIRTRTKELRAAGIEVLPRVSGVRDGLPVLDGGQVVECANVIWCTGYRDDYSWIHVPALDQDGGLLQKRGVVDAVPGFFFLGQEFLFAAVSATLPGVGRDARYLASRIPVPHVTSARASASL
ncbi:flavin-containing monooxygenase [Paenarthrobacter sp. NPDC092416]|uniref:flavin-containing monooxygenase n=1 Tax=Paenarthrobacter sp. NPDC092416 TaxID=3364386 RepID=UPI00381BD442